MCHRRKFQCRGFSNCVFVALARTDSDRVFDRKDKNFPVAHLARPRNFLNDINDLFDQNHYRLIVDLSGLDYISSAGAGVFIGAIGTAQENDGNIILMRPSPNVKEVFDLLGLSQIFTFKDTPKEAEAALR